MLGVALEPSNKKAVLCPNWYSRSLTSDGGRM